MSLHFITLHGFSGTPHDLAPLIPRGYKTTHLAIDQLSSHSDVGALLGKLKQTVEKRTNNVLIGYSLGGRIALWLKSLCPKHVAGLVLLSANPGISSAQIRFQRRQIDAQWAQLFRTSPLDKALSIWLKQPLFHLTPQQIHQVAQTRSNDISGAAGATLAKQLELLSPGRLPSFWPYLPQLDTTPLLYLWGTHDQAYRQIASRIAQTGGCTIDCREIEHAGHNVVYHNAPACQSAIISWIKRRYTKKGDFSVKSPEKPEV